MESRKIPQMTPALVQLAEDILRQATERYPLSYVPILKWKNLRVSAGLAYYRTGTIGLSALILDTPEKLRHTLLHEYAHLLAFERHGRKAANHGIYWQQAMSDLGLPPKVRHNYECARNTPRQKVTYRCKRCGVHIDRNRKLPRNRKYVHARCGGALMLFSVQSATDAAQSA
jgi:predicted SprT family Zn-dependent metalloprotease